MDFYEILVTNPCSGHYGVIRRVGGVPFLEFCSQDRSKCQDYLSKVVSQFIPW